MYFYFQYVYIPFCLLLVSFKLTFLMHLTESASHKHRTCTYTFQNHYKSTITFQLIIIFKKGVLLKKHSSWQFLFKSLQLLHSCSHRTGDAGLRANIIYNCCRIRDIINTRQKYDCCLIGYRWELESDVILTVIGYIFNQFNVTFYPHFVQLSFANLVVTNYLRSSTIIDTFLYI